MIKPLFSIVGLAVFKHGKVARVLAIVTALCFVSGLALLGSSQASGYLYAASIVIGTPLLLLMLLREPVATIPWSARLYAGFLFGFAVICAVDVLLRDTPISVFDHIVRFWFGLINGFFFGLLIGFRRNPLFHLIVVIAAAHLVTASLVAVSQSIDFANLDLVGIRASGTTNAIPFAQMLVVSLGIVVLTLANRIRRERLWLDLGVLGLVVLAGLLALILTGTRGALMMVPWLGLLTIFLLRVRLGIRPMLLVVLIASAILAAVAILAFQDDLESWQWLFTRSQEGVRQEIWLQSFRLIPEAPWFGHGLTAFPEVFREARFALPEDSVVFHFDHAHNQLIDMLLKTGLVGTVLFFGPMAVAVVAAVRMVALPPHRLHGLVILWVATAYFGVGMANSYFAHAATSLQLGVYLGMLIWLVPGRTETVIHQDDVAVSDDIPGVPGMQTPSRASRPWTA